MISAAVTSILDFFERSYAPLHVLAPGTRDDYRCVLGSFVAWQESTGLPRLIDTIEPEHVGRYVAWLVDSGQCGASRAAGHVRVLRAVLKLAKRRHLTAIDLDELPRPRGIKRLPMAWSVTEFEALVSTMRRMPGNVGAHRICHWLPALALTCHSTDWRISAVMRLESANLSLADRWAKSIETKTREERFAGLTDQCVAALSAIWCPHRAHVFGDWPYDRSDRQWPCLNRLLGEAIKLAGIRDIGRWHAIRKTSTTMVARFAGRDEARKHAGHGDQRITDAHYIDPTQLGEGRTSDHLPRLRIDDGNGRQLRLFD